MAGVSHNPTVSRLVMAEVAWAYCRFPLWEAHEGEVSAKHESLLRSLLTFDKGVSCDRRSWILHDPVGKAKQELERIPDHQVDNDPILAAYKWFIPMWKREPEVDVSTRVDGPDKERWWRTGPGAAEAVGRIAEGMWQCGRVATRAWMEHEEALLARQMNLFACRIYLSPEGVAQLVGGADPPLGSVPLHVCIGLRFQDHFEESFTDRLVRYWLYATLSVWTYKPASVFHAPEPVLYEPPIVPPAEFSALRDVCTKTVGEAIRQRIREHYTLPELEILRRGYVPPRFWFARGPKVANSLSSIGEIGSDNFSALTDNLLKVSDVHSAGVAASVINGRILLIRRLLPPEPGETDATPCYIIIPLKEGVVTPENDARKLVWDFTDLEGSIAAQLFDATTSLDIYNSHLNVYKAVVDQADVLWDQLALHLPLAKGIRVHRSIELIHQTLLQGIADLDQVTIEATEVNRKIELAMDELRDTFDRFTERAVERPYQAGDERPIRTSLTETGGFDTALREAKRVHDLGEQVQRSYHTLLDGMSRVFDEQRVRGTDVLQYAGFLFAIFLGLAVPIAEAINVVFDSWKHSSPPGQLFSVPLGWIVDFIGLGGMVWLFALGVLLFLLVRRMSTLGTRPFRRRHQQLRVFLASCATDRLTRLRHDSWQRVRDALDAGKDEEAVWKSYFDEWNKIDRDLARQCAKLVDKLARRKNPQVSQNDPSEVRELVNKVERWALTALLVSERPRQFRLFALPRLTFLYRLYYPMMEVLRSHFPIVAEVSSVSTSDFHFTIDNQCSGDHQQRSNIEEWAQHQIEQCSSALHFVEELDRMHLKPGMTSEDFEKMLVQMDGQGRCGTCSRGLHGLGRIVQLLRLPVPVKH